jgi:hypothetical protein
VGALVTFAGSALAFLRRWLFAGTLNITATLDSLVRPLPVVQPILKDVMDKISPEWLIKDFWVELYSLILEFAAHKVEDWCL